MTHSKKSKNINWKEIALEIHEIISIEISRRSYLYSPSQKKNFKDALNLIDQLDSHLELIKDLDCLYFNTLKKLFRLLKKLHVEQLIITMIIDRYSKYSIF